MSWPRAVSSHALIPFAREGASLPYRSEEGVLVTSVRPRVTWGSAHTGSDMHLIAELAGAWTDKGLILGARWLCGRNTIGAKLHDADAYWSTWRKAYEMTGKTEPDDVVCRKCRDARDGVTTRPVVYRLFDKTGERLLYIGSTKDWEARRRQHAATTWWWPVVRDVKLEGFDTLEEARAAEKLAIISERPQMNIAHNRGVAS